MEYEAFRKRYKYNETTDCIGGGSFGVVYRAVDTLSTIGERTVAIKAPQPGHEHDEDIGIMKEAQIMLETDNLYIARYFEFHNFSEEGKGEIAVMQFYEEGNLRNILDKIPQSDKETLLKQILDGIRSLHSRKPDFIIHKDLKPENILIDNQEGKYIPKISDFGISKLAQRVSSDYVATNDGNLNRRYAAPEQFTSPNISRNVDLYSFGLIAVEVFTGEHPHDNPQAKDSDAIPENWKILINGCLAFDPRNRVQSVAECLEILSQQTDPIEVSPDEEEGGGKSVPTPEPPLLPDNGSGKKRRQWKQLLWLIPLIIIALLVKYWPDMRNYVQKPYESMGIVSDSFSSRNDSFSSRNEIFPSGNEIFPSGNNFFPSGNNFFPQGNDSFPQVALKMEMVTVTLPGRPVFEIGKYEVTQRIWKLVMKSNPSKRFIGDEFPVNNVNVADVSKFIIALNKITGKNYLLPSSDEWQFAQAGGDKSKAYVYSGSNNISQVAWYEGNAGGKMHKVGQLLPNELGLFDMSGNVGEWCIDAGNKAKIYGGHWFWLAETCELFAEPEDMGQSYRGSEVGFRLKRMLE
jgi:serine/threonine protein kinase